MNNLIDENFPDSVYWNLCRYTRWLNSETNLYENETGNATKEWQETPNCLIELRLTKFGHFLIIYGFQVLESYFLVNAKHWFKATNKDNNILILIKYQKNFRRICLEFKSELDCLACLKELEQYISVKSDNANHSNPKSDLEFLNMNDLYAKLNRSSLITTEWPTGHLNHVIKMCLFDPNFPGFVADVEKELSNILNSSEI